jgi:hypothetical protein
MATVRITEELKRAVVHNLRKIYDKRYDAKRFIDEDTNPVAVEGAYVFLMGDYLPKMQGLPNHIFRKAKEMIFTLAGSESHSRACVTVRFKTGQRIMSNAFTDLSITRQHWTYSGDEVCVELVDKDYSDTSLAPVVENLRSMEETIKQQVEAVRQIDRLLGKYSTLSPALKEFPALWDLLPESTRDKHKEVVERKPKRETVSVEQPGDLSGIGAAIIASKLGA